VTLQPKYPIASSNKLGIIWAEKKSILFILHLRPTDNILWFTKVVVLAEKERELYNYTHFHTYINIISFRRSTNSVVKQSDMKLVTKTIHKQNIQKHKTNQNKTNINMSILQSPKNINMARFHPAVRCIDN
jgi:hypothetical protein